MHPHTSRGEMTVRLTLHVSVVRMRQAEDEKEIE